MVFVESPQASDFFYKVRPALYLSGQLKPFHIYPVNMVNSQKKYPRKAARYQSFLITQKDLFLC
jgi:hypothetical protein